MSKVVIKKLPELGNVNAAHYAYIFNADGKIIGTCMDTPNNAAYAFSINPKAAKISTPFNGVWEREELGGRVDGLDIAYHSKYVKYY